MPDGNVFRIDPKWAVSLVLALLGAGGAVVNHGEVQEQEEQVIVFSDSLANTADILDSLGVEITALRKELSVVRKLALAKARTKTVASKGNVEEPIAQKEGSSAKVFIKSFFRLFYVPERDRPKSERG